MKTILTATPHLGRHLDDPRCLPQQSELDVWVRQGSRNVILTGPPLMLREADSELAIEVIRFLRDAASSGLQVDWRGVFETPHDAWQWRHLSAPHTGRNSSVSPGAALPQFHWRRGSGFIRTIDCRRPPLLREVCLRDRALLDMFARIQQPLDVTTAGLDTVERSALRCLLTQHLATTIGPYALALPCHFTRWPIPTSV
ncbi:DUF5825 family protein [Streptomyces mayteni]